MMGLVLRLIGILTLAVLLSGAWLFRGELMEYVRPEMKRVVESLGERATRGDSAAPIAPARENLERAQDKVDSLHGWAADSVVLTAAEMTSLLVQGLPAEARERLDSVRVTLHEGRVTVAARLETTAIPASALGPLAGALEPWEPISGSGLVVSTGRGRAEWRVDALTLRGFTLPPETSRELVSRALPGVKQGAVPFELPPGIARIRIRRGGATLYRETR